MSSTLTIVLLQIYSNGLSEVALGKAIKQFNLPRDELVIMTKVRACVYYCEALADSLCA